MPAKRRPEVLKTTPMNIRPPRFPPPPPQLKFLNCDTHNPRLSVSKSLPQSNRPYAHDLFMFMRSAWARSLSDRSFCPGPVTLMMTMPLSQPAADRPRTAIRLATPTSAHRRPYKELVRKQLRLNCFAPLPPRVHRHTYDENLPYAVFYCCVIHAFC